VLSCDLNAALLKPDPTGLEVTSIPRVASLNPSGTPAASAIKVPRFKNSRRELDIFYPPKIVREIQAGRNGGAVYCFFEKLSTKKQRL
jgi:hypothetical protein